MNLLKMSISLAICCVALPSIANAQCTPFSGSCGGSGQISCSEAHAPYLACLEAQRQKRTGNVGPIQTKENDPAVNTDKKVKQ